MTVEDAQTHTDEKLLGVHPILVTRIRKVLAALVQVDAVGVVVEGLRTTAYQRSLFQQGRTAPGPIVTNDDGIAKRSPHQDGHAVDIAFLVNGTLTWDHRCPWAAYGNLGLAVGLKWGGNFSAASGLSGDLGHLELSAADAAA